MPAASRRAFARACRAREHRDGCQLKWWHVAQGRRRTGQRRAHRQICRIGGGGDDGRLCLRGGLRGSPRALLGRSRTEKGISSARKTHSTIPGGAQGSSATRLHFVEVRHLGLPLQGPRLLLLVSLELRLAGPAHRLSPWVLHKQTAEQSEGAPWPRGGDSAPQRSTPCSRLPAVHGTNWSTQQPDVCRRPRVGLITASSLRAPLVQEPEQTSASPWRHYLLPGRKDRCLRRESCEL